MATDPNYNPLQRDSKISKFIVPSMSNPNDPKNKGFRGRFDDDRTISANIQSIGDPNRKSRADQVSENLKQKDSTFSKNNSSPFRNIFKK